MQAVPKASSFRHYILKIVSKAVLGAFVGTALIVSHAVAIDRIPTPPVQATFSSPAGNYIFLLSTPDNWKSKKAVGELFHIVDGARTRLWTRTLPHEFGPRFVVVGNSGEVLLLDEWINVKSRYAIMIIDPGNKLVAHHDFDAVQRVLGVRGADIVKKARHGIWITSHPILDGSGEMVSVETADTELTIHLSDGRISLPK